MQDQHDLASQLPPPPRLVVGGWRVSLHTVMMPEKFMLITHTITSLFPILFHHRVRKNVRILAAGPPFSIRFVPTPGLVRNRVVLRPVRCLKDLDQPSSS